MVENKNINVSASQVPAEKNNQNLFDNCQINKKGFIEMNGEVTEVLPNLTFRVLLDNNHQILSTLSGKMKMNRIMVMAGDKVKVEISPYDLNKGRINYRY